MAGQVRSERDGALGWIYFDQPERRNAISNEMWQEIPSVARELDADPDVRVVIMRGAGEVAFAAGADISEFEQQRVGEGAKAYDRDNGAAFAALATLSLFFIYRETVRVDPILKAEHDALDQPPMFSISFFPSHAKNGARNGKEAISLQSFLPGNLSKVFSGRHRIHNPHEPL